jgi:hypothetical protein
MCTRSVGQQAGLGCALATISGCTLVMTDLPTDGAPPPGEGLRLALRRATADGLRDRCAVVAANGRHFPFAAARRDHRRFTSC